MGHLAGRDDAAEDDACSPQREIDCKP